MIVSWFMLHLHGNPVKSKTSQREAINKVKTPFGFTLKNGFFYDYFTKSQIKQRQKFIHNQESWMKRQMAIKLSKYPSVSVVNLQMCIIHNMSSIEMNYLPFINKQDPNFVPHNEVTQYKTL